MNPEYKQETIEVFENIGDNVIEFETKEEFDRYYKKNKEFIDNMKTRGLNRKFIIHGFRIGRKKGNIILYPTEIKNKDQSKSDDAYGSGNNVAEETVTNSEINLDELYQIQEDIYKKLDNLNQRLIRIEQFFEKK